MPIAPTFKWSETEETISLVVHGAAPAARAPSALLVADAVVKLSAPPLLLLLDLAHEIDPHTSRAAAVGADLHLELRKAQPALWGSLTAVGDRQALRARRDASIKRAHDAAAAAAEERLKRKQQEERDAVDRRIALDNARREAIAARRRRELEDERGSLTAWQRQLGGGHPQQQQQGGDESDYESDGGEAGGGCGDDDGKGAEDQEPGAVNSSSSSSKEETKQPAARGSDGAAAADHPDYYGRGWWPAQGQQPAADATSDAAEEEHAESTGASGDDSDADAAQPSPPPSQPPRPPPPPIAPQRARCEPVKVTFTRLEAPAHLPARAGREQELSLHRQAKPGELLADSADVTDRQPAFLKDKGDALFEQGNYAGAVNAYTRALALGPPEPAALYANRAAARLKLGESAAARADCDAALALVHAELARLGLDDGAAPPLGDDSSAAAAAAGARARRMAAKLLARRAAAAVQGEAGASAEALAAAERDLLEAQRFDPSNGRLAEDLREVQASLADAKMAPVGKASCSEPAAAQGSDGSDSKNEGGRAAKLRARAEARFAARDFEGAADAFGALVGVLLEDRTKQQQQEQQIESGADASADASQEEAAVARALSNRAACRLPAGRYAECLSDCRLALAELLPLLQRRGVARQLEEQSVDKSSSSAVCEDTVQMAEAVAGAAEACAGCAQEDQLTPLAARIAARAALAAACAKRGADEPAALFAAARRLYAAAGDAAAVDRLSADELSLLKADDGAA